MTLKSRVTPISGSRVAWDIFLKDTQNLTGHSPAKGTDASGQNFSDYARFIVALDEFQAATVLDPVKTLSCANASLEHLHFSFLVVSTPLVILKINELTKLNVISTKTKNKGRVAFVSGTLGEWQQSILGICSNSSYSTELRFIANTWLEFFFHLGLKHIFNDYVRKQLSDGTYLLEYDG